MSDTSYSQHISDIEFYRQVYSKWTKEELIDKLAFAEAIRCAKERAKQ